MANIIKGRFDQPFVTLYNEAVQDPELTARAKGVHAYLLSLPGDWVVRAKELHNHFKEGRDAIIGALNELVAQTYVERRENRDGGKFDGVTYIVYPVKYERAIQLGIITPEGEETPKPKQRQKEDKPKEEIPFQAIIEYLNEKAGKSFKHTTKATQKAISGRWNEGHGMDQFKYVIDVKTDEWKGTEFENYLCPDTLFRPTNFEKYLNQKPKRSKQPQFPFGPPKTPTKPKGSQSVDPVMTEEQRRAMLEEAGIQLD
jgi:uncharacterized phage protein (TIGR02220 family)